MDSGQQPVPVARVSAPRELTDAEAEVRAAGYLAGRAWVQAALSRFIKSGGGFTSPEKLAHLKTIQGSIARQTTGAAPQ